MAGQSIVKRPVVFTWAYLQKYPTLEARYAETLPFCDRQLHPCDDSGDVWYCPFTYSNCECKCDSCVQRMKRLARCIKRTGERWAWFSAARDLDGKCGERLGTLGYLPWEIRQQIFRCFMKKFWCPMIGTVTPSLINTAPLISHNIGLASPSTKVELEYCYLTNTTFPFGEPKDLERFFDSLSTYQQSLLRSFELDLYSDSWDMADPSCWLPICNRLPSNLTSIKFDMHHWVSSVKEPGERWFVSDEGQRYPRFKLDMECLNVLGKAARRRAPRAKIGLVEGISDDFENARAWEYLDEKSWLPVLDELEPWSKEWLEWWAEDTKINLNGGERAIDMV